MEAAERLRHPWFRLCRHCESAGGAAVRLARRAGAGVTAGIGLPPSPLGLRGTAPLVAAARRVWQPRQMAPPLPHLRTANAPTPAALLWI